MSASKLICLQILPKLSANVAVSWNSRLQHSGVFASLATTISFSGIPGDEEWNPTEEGHQTYRRYFQIYKCFQIRIILNRMVL